MFPDEFIPIAEHTGLIGPLTRTVLDAALAQAAPLVRCRATTAGVGEPVGPHTCSTRPCRTRSASCSTRHGVPARALELEVTESAIMTEPARAAAPAPATADLGVRISIDDFGIGYTILARLKNLPVGELKIDRSFVMTMTEDHSNAVIVHGVVDLGHNLGLSIVAEGVETADALATLADFDCDIAQGYHVARPMTSDAFDTWRAERERRAADGAFVQAGTP